MFRTIGSLVAIGLSGLLPTAVISTCAAQSASKQAGVTVLFFHSQDCQPCRQMEPLLVQYQQIGLDVRSVNAPQQLALASQFNIQNLPTLILLRDGKEADRLVGAVSPQQLHQRLSRLTDWANSSPPSLPKSGLASSNQFGPESQLRTASQTMPSTPEAAGGSMVVRGQSPAAVPSASISAGFPMLAAHANGRLDSQPPASVIKPPSKPTKGQSPSAAPSSFRALDVSSDQAAQRAADATVRIKVEESNTTAYGTGTIVATHEQEALILTCGHLFRDMLPGSHLKVDLFAGTPRQTTVLAQLIDFKADKEDIGLLAVRLPTAIAPVPILPSGEPVQVGQPVFSIGCDHGNNPTRHNTQITHVNRYLGPNNIEIEGAPAVGRSGGGLFDLRGRLIGVCNAACNQENEGIYASADVLYQQLSRVDHAHLFQMASGTDQTPIDSTLQTGQIGQLASVAGPSDVVWPDENQAAQTQPKRTQVQPASVEQPQSQPAQTSSGVQVICVVRTPGSADRVVTIDQASDKLLSTLEHYSSAASNQQEQ